MFYTPIEATVRPAPTSKRQEEERELVVDSGASTHMISKNELSSDELDALRRSRTPTVVLTSNGEVQTHEEPQVFVHDFGQFLKNECESVGVGAVNRKCVSSGSAVIRQSRFLLLSVQTLMQAHRQESLKHRCLFFAQVATTRSSGRVPCGTRLSSSCGAIVMIREERRSGITAVAVFVPCSAGAN